MSSFNYNPMSNMHLMTPSTANFLLAQQSKNQNQLGNQHRYVTSGTSPMELENASDEMRQSSGCDHHNEDNGSELVFNGMMGIQPQSFMMLPSVMMDPSMLQQFPILNLPASVNGVNLPATAASDNTKNGEGNSVVKEIIHCASCTLIPPNPTQPTPTTRDRPLGCKTCFIGGLPENITPEIIHEIFERCGEITTLRLSKKNFCHIRFTFEASVDSAIYLSGYRVKIGNNNDPGNTGKLHVDYAQARDDQYEYECRQRQLQREQRHKEKDRTRSASPHVVHYTDHEATSVSEKIKNDETFLKAVQTLIVWLERGDCTKKNANIFYSMIQSTNSHIRRLLNEKCQFEDELREAKEKYQKQMMKTIEQFNQIEKVFNAASHKNQKVWDHFTKAQRKNIDQWRNQQAMEVRTFQLDESFDENDEMDMSDDEIYGSNSKRARIDKSKKKDQNLLHDIKSETDLKDDRSDAELKNKQIKVLQETIRNLQRKLIETNTKEKQNEAKISGLEEAMREANVKELLLRTKVANARTSSVSGASVVNDDLSETSSTLNHLEISGNELQLISLATAYLVIHPKGAELQPLFVYVQQFLPSTSESELHDVLVKNEKLFCTTAESSKWFYNGFKKMP